LLPSCSEENPCSRDNDSSVSPQRSTP
jgi:hypothetical protein